MSYSKVKLTHNFQGAAAYAFAINADHGQPTDLYSQNTLVTFPGCDLKLCTCINVLTRHLQTPLMCTIRMKTADCRMNLSLYAF